MFVCVNSGDRTCLCLFYCLFIRTLISVTHFLIVAYHHKVGTKPVT